MKMQAKICLLLFTSSVVYLVIEYRYINHEIIKSCDALCRIDDANVSNLILIITAVCNSLERLAFNTVVWLDGL